MIRNKNSVLDLVSLLARLADNYGTDHYCWGRVRYTSFVTSLTYHNSITGLAIASQLSRHHKITTVAKNLPGDEPTLDWASPWAGANFVAGYCSSPRDRKMQRDAFAELWRLTTRCPESSVKKIPMEEVYDQERTDDDLWYKEFVSDVSSKLRRRPWN